MAIEHAGTRTVPKPWGSTDLRPWSGLKPGGDAIGEIWFQRPGRDVPDPALLLKLLFTRETLSIQVHPDDDYARSIGLPRGKTEAWVILEAEPGARVALGLTRPLAPAPLRAAIADGSIAELIQWRMVMAGQTLLVPAGTIHAIGPGLVIAEIQQRSDATFRLFDHGRDRELQIDHAVAATHAGPLPRQTGPRRLSPARTLLAACPQFKLERIDLPAGSAWQLHGEHETWLLVVAGQAGIAGTGAAIGDVFFVEAGTAAIRTGPEGLKALLAYPALVPGPGLFPHPYGPDALVPAPALEVRP